MLIINYIDSCFSETLFACGKTCIIRMIVATVGPKSKKVNRTKFGFKSWLIAWLFQRGWVASHLRHSFRVLGMTCWHYLVAFF